MGISAQRLGAHPQASGMKAASGCDRPSPQTGIAYRPIGVSHKDPGDMPGPQPRLRRGVLFLFGAARSPAYAPG